jgi:hypothetical protein
MVDWSIRRFADGVISIDHQITRSPNDKIVVVMRPLASAIPGALAALLRDAPLSPGKVSFAWRAAVGAALERETAVRLIDGTLVVDAASRLWAREVTRSSPPASIAPRARHRGRHLGAPA